MADKKRLVLYFSIFLVGLLTFILEIFVFQKPDGALGLVISILSIFMIYGGAVKLCKMSSKLRDTFICALDILFWLP